MAGNYRTALALLFTIAVAACQTTSAPSVAPTGSAPPSQASESATAQKLHFYLLAQLTGPQAVFGTRIRDAALLRLQELREAGGLDDQCGNHYSDVELSVFDVGTEPANTVARIREAAADPSVLAIHGPVDSLHFPPAIPVADEFKIPIIATGSGVAIKDWSPWAYRVPLLPPDATPEMLAKLEQLFDIKRLGIIHDATNDGYVADAQLMINLASEVGYEVVADVSYRAGDVDMRPQLTTIKGSNPDWIAFEMPGGEGLATVFNQAVELGLGEVNRVTGFDGWANPVTWDLTDGAVAGGYSWAAPRHAGRSDIPEIAAFNESFRKFSGVDPIKEALYSYDIMSVYLDAVARSCTATDREAFNKALRDTKWQGLGGGISWGPDTGNNQSTETALVRTMERGKSEIVE